MVIKKFIKKPFSLFFSTKNELTKSISGTGLGLSIVKRIVDLYSGKIEVETEFSTGTTFRIFLPTSLIPYKTTSL
jgi:signal transduction histidine kinase